MFTARHTAPGEAGVALDLTMVHSLDDVARRMLLEVARRLTLDGHEVYLVDPESVLPDPNPGDGGRVILVDDLDEAPTSSVVITDARAPAPMQA